MDNFTSAAPSAGAILDELKETYAVYREEAAQAALDNASMLSGLKTVVLGHKPTGERALHKQFYADVTRLIGELVTALAVEERVQSGEYALQAAELMLEAANIKKPQALDWTLMAAEPLFAPLLPCLSDQGLTVTLERYISRYPKRALMPTQKELLRAMERERKGRG